ncbi:MAG TPA: 30S ribosomal protein S6 [Thermoanaerobaculia bacterium]|nr:30S ribosomal protein S6 [Thermoanaerobaculia bacterium]
MRTYELVFIVDPRVSDEDVVTLIQEYKQMISAGGSEISLEENWGRRKLAYPIDKLTEGKYVLLGVTSQDGKTSLAEVEHRMRQNDKILRYLTVRTDEDLKRAARRKPAGSGGPESGIGSGTGSGSGAGAAEAPDDDDVEIGDQP